MALIHAADAVCLKGHSSGLATNACLPIGCWELQPLQEFAVCVQENEAVQEEKKKQLYEEGIDAILARAEVCTLTLFVVFPAEWMSHAGPGAE